MIGNFLAVLNFNRLFLKHNRFICHCHDFTTATLSSSATPAAAAAGSEKQAVAKPQRLPLAHNERPPPEPRKGPA